MTSLAAILALAALRLIPPTDISRDETVTFFPTCAWTVADDNDWRVEVHGWIYEPEQRGALLAIFHAALGLGEEPATTSASGSAATQPSIFKHRASAFLVDNERNQSVPVRFGERVFMPPPSESNGHFAGVFRLPELDAPVPGRWLTFDAVMPPGDERVFSGRVRLISAEGISVVSDIDDTIKISDVRDRDELLKNTFVRPFRAVDGMAGLYRRWESSGDVAFHYISSSPWQLYAPLTEFLQAAGFPDGTFHLKHFRWRDEAILDVFKKPDRHKITEIETLLSRFPKRRFVLVGDSGERDPEIYGAIARKHSRQVAAIAIRDVTNEPDNAARYSKAFEGLPRDSWRVFKKPDELTDIRP